MTLLLAVLAWQLVALGWALAAHLLVSGGCQLVGGLLPGPMHPVDRVGSLACGAGELLITAGLLIPALIAIGAPTR